MKHLALAALLAGCATHTSIVAPVEEAGAAIEATSAPSPTAAPPSPHRTMAPKASRSRRPRSRAETGSLLHWAALRECESSGNYRDRDSVTYRGAYQFDRQTWQTVGGTGDPADASPAEQDMRALRLYRERGRSPWPVCGRHL